MYPLPVNGRPVPSWNLGHRRTVGAPGRTRLVVLDRQDRMSF
ncbi:hypothetical protein I545_6986 [Mycobacterium kansasii 662]|uniref:Uncharacterized protein n=1 Tax=Mycobacterium kansasii 662 TaxID=1299326 RepID=X7XQH2_MYCKA|nr:hypothetical protein I545_6986 [Mycobacterium kansasii 662]